MKNKSGQNKSGQQKSGTNAVKPGPVVVPTTPAAGATPATTPPVAAAKKARKPGPFATMAAGSNVEYTLPSGTKIQALVTKDGHACCPTCAKTLATATVPDVVKVAKSQEREQERIGGLQAEFLRIRDIIAKERARTGLPVLTEAELFKAVIEFKPEPETAPEAKAS